MLPPPSAGVTIPSASNLCKCKICGEPYFHPIEMMDENGYLFMTPVCSTACGQVWWKWKRGKQEVRKKRWNKRKTS